MTPGPIPGSNGARRISEVHSGSHEHDARGGFASNPELAREAGRKGGEAVSKKYGPQFYREIGAMGGAKMKAERGSEFYVEIGRRGGLARAARYTALRERLPFNTSCLICSRDHSTCERYIKASREYWDVRHERLEPSGYYCSEYEQSGG